MTTGEYTPLLRDGSNRATTQHHLAISAHYYDITDIESWPIAGLLVLLDGQGQPVRAELHLYDDLEPQVQEGAIRQARVVLQDSYLGGQPVPVRILETLQVREEMLVRLPPVGTRSVSAPILDWKWRPYGMIGAAILLMVALIWVISALIGTGRENRARVSVASTPASISQAGEQQSTAPLSSEAEGNADVSVVPASSEAEDDANALAAPTAVPGEPADSSPSRNARSDLGIGVKVKVVSGLRVALRSEPGSDRGIVIGELSGDDIATIVGGPEYSAGDSDTIVWWFVALPNTTQAWAAANTSKETLLVPAQ